MPSMVRSDNVESPDRGGTSLVTEIVYTRVVPFSAVTVIEISVTPTGRLDTTPPATVAGAGAVITALAAVWFVVAATVTLVTVLATLCTNPGTGGAAAGSALVPLTVRADNVASFDSTGTALVTEIVYTRVVVPFSAVTVTEILVTPTGRFDTTPPATVAGAGAVIATVAPEWFVVAATVTLVTALATLCAKPGRGGAAAGSAFVPLTVRADSVASFDRTPTSTCIVVPDALLTRIDMPLGTFLGILFEWALTTGVPVNAWKLEFGLDVALNTPFCTKNGLAPTAVNLSTCTVL